VWDLLPFVKQLSIHIHEIEAVCRAIEDEIESRVSFPAQGPMRTLFDDLDLCAAAQRINRIALHIGTERSTLIDIARCIGAICELCPARQVRRNVTMLQLVKLDLRAKSLEDRYRGILL